MLRANFFSREPGVLLQPQNPASMALVHGADVPVSGVGSVSCSLSHSSLQSLSTAPSESLLLGICQVSWDRHGQRVSQGKENPDLTP